MISSVRTVTLSVNISPLTHLTSPSPSLSSEQQCDSSGESPPQLPVPHLLSQQTRVLVSPEQAPHADGWTPASGATFADDEEDNVKWVQRLSVFCDFVR